LTCIAAAAQQDRECGSDIRRREIRRDRAGKRVARRNRPFAEHVEGSAHEQAEPGGVLGGRDVDLDGEQDVGRLYADLATNRPQDEAVRRSDPA
jgi:hypothetical protein